MGIRFKIVATPAADPDSNWQLNMSFKACGDIGVSHVYTVYTQRKFNVRLIKSSYSYAY